MNSNIIECPKCGSDQIQKRGTSIEGKQRYQCTECTRYFSFSNDDEFVGSSFEEKGNFIRIVCSSPRILSEEELIKQFKIDTSKWEIVSLEVKTHEGYRKDRKVEWQVHNGEVTHGYVDDTGKMLVVPIFNMEAHFERKTKEIRKTSALLDLMNDAKKHSVKYPKITYPKLKNGLLYELDLPDIHFGRLTWEEESGENYDIKLAEEYAVKVTQTLLSYAKSFPIGKVLFPLGNDFFNVNNKNETTVHGTPQQEDTRWQKTFRKGRQLAVKLIEMCSQIAPVDVIIIAGNHDEERMFYLGDSLDAWFHNNPNVTIDNRAIKRKYYLFEKVLLGFTHGYYEKAEKLPFLMPTEVPEWWAKSKYREWHLGDKHHKKEFEYKTNEDRGMTIRVLRALASTDAWTFDKGYVGAIKAGESFLWHPLDGLVAQFTASP